MAKCASALAELALSESEAAAMQDQRVIRTNAENIAKATSEVKAAVVGVANQATQLNMLAALNDVKVNMDNLVAQQTLTNKHMHTQALQWAITNAELGQKFLLLLEL